MSLRTFFARIFSATRVDYSGFSDDRLRELWGERSTLTDEAVELLKTEASRRGLALSTAEPPRRDRSRTGEAPRTDEDADDPGFEDDASFDDDEPLEENDDDFVASLAMESDGTQTLRLGGEKVLLNRPDPDAHAGAPIDDPLRVASALASAFRKKPLNGSPEYLFVEACWLIADDSTEGLRREDFRAPERRALVTAIDAARRADPILCLRSLRETGADLEIRSVWAEALLIAEHPADLERACLSGEVEPGPSLIGRVAREDPERTPSLLAHVADEDLRLDRTRHALLSAMDAGHPVPTQLAQTWEQAGVGAWERRNFTWLGGEIQRLARSKLDQALLLWSIIPSDLRATYGGSEDLFRLLARVDPNAAMDLVSVEKNPYGVDVLPCLIGASLGGMDIREPLALRLSELEADAYHPVLLFFRLVEAYALLGDVDGVCQVLERGGPSGWQTVEALRDPVVELFRRDPARASELVRRVTRQKVRPGVVAGRDASAPGFHVGQVVFRPKWLTFESPRPLDTLHVLAELGGAGPHFTPERSLE